MSLLREKVLAHIADALLARPAVAHGVLIAYDPATRLGVVRLRNPSGEGTLELPNLYLPEAVQGLEGGDPPVGSQVTLAIPAGAYRHAEVTAVRPPTKRYRRTARDRAPVETLTSTRLP